MATPHPTLPREAVRDLLGIARALYRVARGQASENAELLNELAAVGRMYRRALSVCARLEPGDPAYLDGVLLARRATRRFAKAVNLQMTVHSLLRAVGPLVTDAPWDE